MSSAKDDMDSKHSDRTTAGTDPIEAVRDDVLRKIGRNVVNFQKMEAMLKALNAQQSISGSLSDLHALATNARKAVAKKTMGPLVEAFVNSAFSAAPEPREHAVVKEVAVSFSFRIEANEAIAKERKKALRAVVAERNRLVHRWLPEFDPHSKDSCLRLSAELDAQHARVAPEFEALKSIFTAFKDLRTGMVCYLASDEFLNAISRESFAVPEVNR
jgi:hypothetical protein